MAPAAPPPDGLGDGNSATPIVIGVDVTTLTQKAASDYRQDLIRAIYHPGTDFDMVGAQGESDLVAYQTQLLLVDTYLATFEEKILCHSGRNFSSAPS
jgi:hypothetical protein